MSHKIRVMLVNQHQLVLSGLANFLISCQEIEIAGEVSSGADALQHVEQWMPDVMVLDLLLPGSIDALETIRRTQTLYPYTKVVVMTGYADNARIMAALGIGALGYVRQEADPHELIQVIQAAVRGQAVVDPSIACTMIQELTHGTPHYPKLTAREQTILRQYALGRTHNEIADVLTISPEAIQTHVGNILTKLQLLYRKQAMLYALKKGLITVDGIELFEEP